MDETCRLRRGEGYEACEDESPKAQLQRRCKNGTSGASGKEFRAFGAVGRTGASAPTLHKIENVPNFIRQIFNGR